MEAHLHAPARLQHALELEAGETWRRLAGWTARTVRVRSTSRPAAHVSRVESRVCATCRTVVRVSHGRRTGSHAPRRAERATLYRQGARARFQQALRQFSDV